MNTFTCALWNEASQKRGNRSSTVGVGNSQCCGEVHGSKLALKMRNIWLTVTGLLILALRKHLYGYLWLLFMANITENLKSELVWSHNICLAVLGKV